MPTPPGPPVRRKRVALAVFLAFCVAVFLFTPEAVGLGWRLIGGKTTARGRVAFAVPFPWFAWNRDDILLLGRAARFLRMDASTIYVDHRFPSTQAASYPYDRAKALWTTQEEGNGYRPGAEHKINASGHEGLCMEFPHKQQARQLIVNCVLPSLGVFAHYAGERRFAADFYAVLQGASPVGAARGSSAVSPGN